MLAVKRFNFVLDRDNILKSSEFRPSSLVPRLSPLFDILSSDSGGANSPSYLVMVWYHNWLFYYLLKSCADRLIKSRSALEADIVTDFTSSNDAVEIISNNRITQAGDQLACFGTLLLIA